MVNCKANQAVSTAVNVVCFSCQGPLCVYSLSIIIGGHVQSQTLRMCRTVAALSYPLMREALISCSGGRICSLKVAGTNSVSQNKYMLFTSKEKDCIYSWIWIYIAYELFLDLQGDQVFSMPQSMGVKALEFKIGLEF